MPPERSKQLVDEIRAFYATGTMRQKDLAAGLELSPQALNEILAGRNQPNSETTLRMLEFLQTMKPQLVDPPAMPRASTRDPSEPRTLHEAKGMIEDLRAQLKGGAVSLPPKPAAAPTSPKAKAQSAGDPGADPTYPPTGTPGGDQPNKTPMASGPKAPKKALPPEANTPVLIQKILDVTTLDDLRLLLNNPAHTPTQQSCIYAEVKKRRSLVANRFE